MFTRNKTSFVGATSFLPALVAMMFIAAAQLHAQFSDASNTESDAAATSSPQAKVAAKLPEPKGAKRLSPDYDAWIDAKQKAVIVDGQVSLREGMLEMFACTRNTKEHESIVSANTKAFLVHAALLGLGAEAGHPAQFVPKYRPPSGTEIDVTLMWIDEQGKEKTAKAQDWVKDIHTNKAMKHPFVFAGSFFRTDEETKKRYYQAEGGDFICVSNFSTAMLDVPILSSPTESDLLFEAYTKRIPPLGAPVRMILTPKLKGQGAAGREQGAPKTGAATAKSKATEAERDASP
jgi:hypothetical protein